MRYVSTFSGIEAASVAWAPLGWEPMAFAEVDAFPCAVLRERFPEVPNLGDVREVDWLAFAREHGTPDVVVGGSPCQSFSIAGRREGLRGESGLMFEFVRCVRELRPRWLLWENVPGALSSERGAAFGQLLHELADVGGYGLAWRVLDAQFFGVAQRRRRVFLVGRARDRYREACQVLFEPDFVPGNSGSSRQKRAELAARAGGRASCAGFQFNQGAGAGGLGIAAEQAPTVKTDKPPAVPALQNDGGTGHRQNGDGWSGDGAAYTLDVRDRPGVCQPVTFGITSQGVVAGDAYPTLGVGGQGGTHNAVAVAANQRGEVRWDGGDGQTVGAVQAHASGKQVQAVLCMATGQANAEVGEDVGTTLNAAHEQPIVASTLKLRHTGSENRGGGQGALVSEDVSLTLSTQQDQSLFALEDQGYVVRRLTPRECERLQGFPDDWTLVPYRGRPAEQCPDGPRYKALGNSMAVPVVRWIGERMQTVDKEE